MKKIFALILAFMILGSCIMAENYDLATAGNDFYWIEGSVVMHFFEDCEDIIADGPDVRLINGCSVRLARKILLDEAPAALVDGVSVPPGEYYVGEDLPAGKYTISVDESVVAEIIEVRKNKKDTIGTSYWIGSMYGGPTANITLVEENILVIKSHTVTISTFKGLF